MSNSTHLLNLAKLNARIDEAEEMTSKAEKLLTPEKSERLGEIDEPEFVTSSSSTAEYMRKIRGGMSEQPDAMQLALQGLSPWRRSSVP